MEKKKTKKEPNCVCSLLLVRYTRHKNVAGERDGQVCRVGGEVGVDGSSIETAAQGCAPVAAGTCVARALGDEMTGEPAMLPSGCWEDDIDVMPGTQNKE